MKTMTNNKKNAKESKRYMSGKFLKGSKEEIAHLIQNAKEERVMTITDRLKHPRYIIYDFETFVNKDIGDKTKIDKDGNAEIVMLHQPMHVEVDILKVSDNHLYEDSLIETKSFTGLGCERKFCEMVIQ